MMARAYHWSGRVTHGLWRGLGPNQVRGWIMRRLGLRRPDRIRPENYYIKDGYVPREFPEYCWKSPGDGTTQAPQEDGITWQPEVYPFAAENAERLGCKTIIDLGCGNATKLARLYRQHPDWTFVGVDYGPNLEWCRHNHGFGIWREADLEREASLCLEDGLIRDSIVVCADVIEHLMNPNPLLGMIHGMLIQGSKAVVLSTPERDLTYGIGHFGPSPNLCHVREWNVEEFRARTRRDRLQGCPPRADPQQRRRVRS